MASEITPGRKAARREPEARERVLVLTEIADPRHGCTEVTVNVERWVQRDRLLPLDDLREVLTWAHNSAVVELLTEDVSLDAREAHERLWTGRRDQAAALLAQLGSQG